MIDTDSEDEADISRRRREDIGDPDEDDPEEDRADEIPIARHYQHPPLPITAPDFSYVMDLTDMRSLLGVKTGKVKADKGLIDAVARIVTNAVNNNRVNNGYRYLLSIIDTTSRKAWQYPLKRKDAGSVYTAFRKFMNDVHGKIARLLSDHDTAFSTIRANNDHFTYCSIVAKHNNHKQFGLIDRFTRTFRELLYMYFRDHGHGPDYSWYVAYPIVLDTYNNARHKGLFLRGHPQRGEHRLERYKKFYYTPNQVWFSPKLRSRIRLRKYFDGYANYLPGTLYDRIKNAPRVRVRLLRDELGHGADGFSDATYEKGLKRGNAWLVNNRWYTYRNLLPVDDEDESHDAYCGLNPNDSDSMKIAKRRIYRSKYKFRDAQRAWLQRHPKTERESQVKSKPYKNRKGIRVRAAREVGALRAPFVQRNGRDDVDIGMDYMDELSEEEREDNNPKRKLRSYNKLKN